MRTSLTEWGPGREAWFITWSIVYEFVRVATHRPLFACPFTFAEAWEFIESLRTSRSLGILVEAERHTEVVGAPTLEYPQVSGNRLHDLHLAALIRQHGGVEIRAADVGFHQFRFLRVVNPL